VTDESVITHHAKISPTIVLITGHFSNSAKFRGNGKILRQLKGKFRGSARNSVARGKLWALPIYHNHWSNLVAVVRSFWVWR